MAPPAGTLPAHLPPFVGRRDEMRSLDRLLRDHRLVSLLGMGGIGKTRLALALAGQAGGRWSGGARLVELGMVSDPRLVGPAIAAALGVPEDPARDAVEVVAASLVDERLLLVLDECEHVAASAGPLAGRLLAACPGLTILATSRMRLGVPGEVTWRVGPLVTPARARGARLDVDAVALFVEHARRARPDWRPSSADLAVIGEIVDRLEGIPLAIELAAAWIAILPPADLLARLDRRFEVLVNRDRTARRRHASLRAAIDSTYEALPAGSRSALRRLALFAGGWTLESMARVCGVEEAEALQTLAELIDRSVVIAPTASAGAARYRMLDTVREYAAAKLREAGEQAAATARFAEHFAELAEAAAARARGAGAAAWLSRLDSEQSNLGAVLELDGQTYSELQLRIVTALADYWSIRGRYAEARLRLQGALGGGGGPPELRARALNALAFFALAQGDHEVALRTMRSSLAVARGVRDQRGAAFARQQLTQIALHRRRLRAARYWAGRALEAGARAEPALVALCHLRLGQVALAEGDLDTARVELSRTVRLAQSGPDDDAAVIASIELARVDFAEGLADAAERRLLSILESLGELAGPRRTMGILRALSAIAAGRGDAASAARLAGIAAGIAEESGQAGLEPVDESLLTRPEYGEGRRLGAAQGVAYVLGRGVPPPPVASPPGRLTRRQLTVARLVAQGLSNKEIARELWISERTVEGHVEQLRNKLGVGTRVQVAAWYLRHVDGAGR